MNYRTSLAGMATVLSALFAPALAAQELTITPGDVLTHGETAKLEYKDENRAGQTIVVVVTSSGLNPEQQEVQITLDSKGEGSATWDVPTWRAANFTAPGVTSITLPCVPSGTKEK